ncbi:MAG: hypothetical protein F6K56_46155, partial [Moorea sp. SIO3G5]|nr:hypothetical protein [Moorena sp. SIO3G5]
MVVSVRPAIPGAVYYSIFRLNPNPVSRQPSAVSHQPSAYFIQKHRLRYGHAARTVAMQWPHGGFLTRVGFLHLGEYVLALDRNFGKYVGKSTIISTDYRPISPYSPTGRGVGWVPIPHSPFPIPHSPFPIPHYLLPIT